MGNCTGDPITVPTTTGPFDTTIFASGWYCGALPNVPVTNNTDLDNHGLLKDIVIGDLLNTFEEIGDIPMPNEFGLRTDIENFSLQMDWQATDALTVSVLGGHNQNRTGTIRDNDNTDAVFWANLGYQRYWAWTAEARALYDDGGPLRGLFGVSKYQHNTFGDIDSGPGVFFVFPPGRGQQIERDRIETTGVFASLEYDLSERFSVAVEGRYQVDKVRNDGGALGGPKTTGPVIDYKKFLPRVILTTKPLEGATVYVSFSQGALPGLRQAVTGTVKMTP